MSAKRKGFDPGCSSAEFPGVASFPAGFELRRRKRVYANRVSGSGSAVTIGDLVAANSYLQGKGGQHRSATQEAQRMLASGQYTEAQVAYILMQKYGDGKLHVTPQNVATVMSVLDTDYSQHLKQQAAQNENPYMPDVRRAARLEMLGQLKQYLDTREPQAYNDPERLAVLHETFEKAYMNPAKLKRRADALLEQHDGGFKLEDESKPVYLKDTNGNLRKVLLRDGGDRFYVKAGDIDFRFGLPKKYLSAKGEILNIEPESELGRSYEALEAARREYETAVRVNYRMAMEQQVPPTSHADEMQKSYDRARELSELVLKQGLERAMPDGGVTSFDRSFIATTEFAKGFDLTGGLFVGALQDTYRYYRTQGQQNWARKMLYGMSFNSTREQLSDLQYYGAIIATAMPGVGLAGRMARVFSRVLTKRLTSRLARGYSGVRGAGAADVFGSVKSGRFSPHPHTRQFKFGEINPGYEDLAPGRLKNCTNCVVATDAVLDGRPAVAMPLHGRGRSLRFLEETFGNEAREMMGYGEIKAHMLQGGSGARAVVVGQYSGRPGHVFNVINYKGKIVFLDGQTGKLADLVEYHKLKLLPTNFNFR